MRKVLVWRGAHSARTHTACRQVSPGRLVRLCNPTLPETKLIGLEVGVRQCCIPSSAGNRICFWGYPGSTYAACSTLATIPASGKNASGHDEQCEAYKLDL